MKSVCCIEPGRGEYLCALGVVGALCIAVDATAEAPPNRYRFETPGVTYDTLTKLAWQRELPTSYSPICASGAGCTWDEAKRYCNELTLAGVTGWRLPTRAELLTIADRTESDPAIDRRAFPATPSAFFWSSSPRVGSKTAWSVSFLLGSSGDNGKDYPDHVRCVY